MRKLRANIFERQVVKIKTHDTAQNRGRNFLWIGGAKNKHDVRRRLFEGLKQRIKGCSGEHVHLVDDIHLKCALYRGIFDMIDDLRAHIIHARSRCRVEFKHIGVRRACNAFARFAAATRQIS